MGGSLEVYGGTPVWIYARGTSAAFNDCHVQAVWTPVCSDVCDSPAKCVWTHPPPGHQSILRPGSAD